MLNTPPDKLEFPFYVFASKKQLEDKDLSFSYHAFVNLEDNSIIAMCNDIPCEMCKFSCKEGINRTSVLAEYAKTNFPEMMI